MSAVARRALALRGRRLPRHRRGRRPVLPPRRPDRLPRGGPGARPRRAGPAPLLRGRSNGPRRVPTSTSPGTAVSSASPTSPGVLHLATGSGLEADGRLFDVRDGLPSLRVSAVASWRGTPVFALERGGWGRLGAAGPEMAGAGFGELEVRTFAETEGGELLVGARQGLYRAPFGAGEIEKLDDAPVRSIALPAGRRDRRGRRERAPARLPRRRGPSPRRDTRPVGGERRGPRGRALGGDGRGRGARPTRRGEPDSRAPRRRRDVRRRLGRRLPLRPRRRPPARLGAPARRLAARDAGAGALPPPPRRLGPPLRRRPLGPPPLRSRPGLRARSRGSAGSPESPRQRPRGRRCAPLPRLLRRRSRRRRPSRDAARRDAFSLGRRLGRQRAPADGRRRLRRDASRRLSASPAEKPACSKAQGRPSPSPPPARASRSATARGSSSPVRVSSRPSTASRETRPTPSPRPARRSGSAPPPASGASSGGA